MTATLQQLVTVRSQRVLDWLEYLGRLEQEASTNRLLERFGRKLDDIRVPLRVVPHEPIREIKEVQQRERAREGGAETHDEDEARRRVYAFRGGMFADEETKGSEPKPLDDLELSLDMAVLLGDPGSGKTEWLKHRTCTAVQEARAGLEAQTVALDEIAFPACLRLTEVSAALDRGDSLGPFLAAAGCVASPPAALNDAKRGAAAILLAMVEHHHLPKGLVPWLWAKLTMGQGRLNAAAARSRARGPRILLCLDAWDEVRSGRKELAQCLDALARTASARIFLTSRIVGYDQRPLPVTSNATDSRRELRICPFAWEETEDFISGFFCGDPDLAQQMLAELRSKAPIAGMVQNPLMATLLCMAFAPSRDRPPLALPARRVEVYQRVLEGLLGQWQADDKGERPDAELIEEKLRLLEEMALWFFPDEELDRRHLRDFLWDSGHGYMSGLDEDHPLRRFLGRTGHGLVEELCKDGVLVPCGGTTSFLFLHLTFQEYLAARRLASLVNDSDWDRATTRVKGLDEPVSVSYLVDKKAWDPVWQEVVILLAGELNDPKPLLRMLSAPEPTETNQYGDDVYRHRLALAVECMPETLPGVRPSMARVINGITTSLFSLWCIQSAHGGRPAPHLTRSLPALAQLNGVSGWEGTPRRLLTAVGALLKSRDPRARSLALSALSHMGPAAATAEMKGQLGDLLRDDDADVRRSAVAAVGYLGPSAAVPNILGPLADLLRDDDADVRSSVVDAVGYLGSSAAVPNILGLLADLLRDDDADVRRLAVAAVGSLGPSAAVPNILGLLADLLRDINPHVQKSLYRAFFRLGAAAATPSLVANLAELLRDRAWLSHSLMALKYLRETAATPQILGYMPVLLQDDDDTVRLCAAHVVGCLGQSAATPQILSRLADLLRDVYGYIREAAAEAIGQLGEAAATPEMLSSLAELLRNDPGLGPKLPPAAAFAPDIFLMEQRRLQLRGGFVREAAAETIGYLGVVAATPQILGPLTEVLRDDHQLGPKAVKAVGCLGKAAATTEILGILCDLLQSDSESVREAAAEAIGRLGEAAATPQVLDCLADLLGRHDDRARWSAAEAVSRLGRVAATREILGGMSNLLRQGNLKAAEMVGHLGEGAATPQILDCLADLLGGYDDRAVSSAAEAVSRLGRAAATPQIIGRLAERASIAHPKVREALERLQAQGLRFFEGPGGKWEARSVPDVARIASQRQDRYEGPDRCIR